MLNNYHHVLQGDRLKPSLYREEIVDKITAAFESQNLGAIIAALESHDTDYIHERLVRNLLILKGIFSYLEGQY